MDLERIFLWWDANSIAASKTCSRRFAELMSVPTGCPLMTRPRLDTGIRLTAEMQREGVIARLFGGAAIAFYCCPHLNPILKDLDLVIQRSGIDKATKVLRRLGWSPDSRDIFLGDQRRIRFLDEVRGYRLDLFSDPLVFSQRIQIGRRLSLFPVALSPADLLLTKLQIHNFTERDAKQVRSLMDVLPISTLDDSSHSINYLRMSDLCRKDWSLYFAVERNLSITMSSYNGTESQPANWYRVARFITGELCRARKTPLWKLRCLIGTRIRWYNFVDE